MAQIFPKWSNKVPLVVLCTLLFGGCAVVFVIWYWLSPWNLNVGYEPRQPVPFSHKMHAGELGIDCRFCHAGVEISPVAGVPPTQTCMVCHSSIKNDSVKLEEVMESWNSDVPIAWRRVYSLPDYVYFDHSAHINNGVGCISCHGRVDQSTEIRQELPLSMDWCLDCHRDPSSHIRPLDKVTDMNWLPNEAWNKYAAVRAKELHPPTVSCTGCHR